MTTPPYTSEKKKLYKLVEKLRAGGVRIHPHPTISGSHIVQYSVNGNKRARPVVLTTRELYAKFGVIAGLIE